MKISKPTVLELSGEVFDKRAKNWRRLIPAEFKNFMLNNNGGLLSEKLTIKEWIVERFLCIVEPVSSNQYGSFDIDVVASRYDSMMAFSEDTVGLDLIPFAALNHDSFLCLCYKTDLPSVAVWQLKGSSVFSPNVIDVYASFADFLDKTNYQ